MTWKPLSFRAALAAAALIAAAGAACADDGAQQSALALREFVQSANRQFDFAIRNAQQYPGHPEIAGLVAANKRIFNANTDKYLHQKEYQRWEVDYVRDSVHNALEGIRQKLGIVERAGREGWNQDRIHEELHNVDATVHANQVQIQDHAKFAALAFGQHRDDGGGKNRPDGKDASGAATGGFPWPGRDPANDSKTHQDEWANSEAVKLQDYAIGEALKPGGGGGVTPPGGGGGSSPSGGGTGGGTGGSSANPGGGTLADKLSGLTNTGVVQALTTAGANALDGGRYAAAASNAQSALSLDPTNQAAMMILHSSQGRTEAGGGSAGPAAGGGSERGFAGGPAADGGRATFGAAARGGDGGRYGAAGRLSGESSAKEARNAMSLNDLSGAMAAVNRALAQNPNDPALLNLRASIHARLKEYALAAADAKAGLANAPKNAALLRTLAYAQLRNKDYKDALASANGLIELDPQDAYGYALRGHAYGSLGEREAMLADLRRAAELDPRFQATLAQVQLPSDSDILFLFPGEAAPNGAAAAAGAGGRARKFGVIAGAAAFGGLLLAIGLLQTVLAPLKRQVSSVFTRLTRTGPSVASPADPVTAQPASAAGHLPGLIRGQYEIARQIGQGGMGTVFEGTDRSLGRRVAIKKMRDELRVNAQERARFVIEAKTVAALHHPNIVDIYAIAEDGQDVFLIFEYVDGRTAHELVQRAGRLPAAEAARIVRASADALGYAHSRGVIHRDMKPSNVMLDGSGRVKVMDFGIARMAKDSATRYSMTNTVVGTPPYMAPEQEQGQVRRESDVYALAVCAYEMLTGKLPFVGIGAGMLMNKINMSYIAPSHAIAGLPAGLDEVFQKAFQAEPEKRYRTPQDFADALERALPGAIRA